MNPPVAQSESVLSDEEFAKFCEFFYRKTGIMFDAKKKYFAERRIIDRMNKTSCATFREYFSNVRFEASGAEMQRLVNQMTVNETYFFREDYQFKALVEGILPDLASRRKGSEPDSAVVGAVLVRRGTLFARHLHPGTMGRCRPLQYRDHGFGYRLHHPRPGGRRRIRRALPAATVAGSDQKVFHQAKGPRIPDFRRPSLLDRFLPGQRRRSGMFMRQFRNIDVIFCRNMLIYFDDKSRRETIEAMYDCMSPGGYICLGHSESMSRISSLFRARKYRRLDHLPKAIRERVMDNVQLPTTKTRILVVEDGITMRMFYRRVLEGAGFEVEEAVNGIEGVERAMTGSFDLLVVDVNMPKMDGYQVIRTVREDPSLWRVPVITISTESIRSRTPRKPMRPAPTST